MITSEGHHVGQDDLSWVEGYADDPKGVQEFCSLHDLAQTLETAVRLAGELFPAVKRLKLSVTEDPENGAKWLTVRVVAGCASHEATNAYQQFIAEWIASVPRFKRGMVRLSYGVG